MTATSYIEPVRVRQGAGWVPVSTKLRPAGAGMVAPGALPGDAVAFSGGGSGPMAVISVGGRSVSLWWPGALPAPTLSGASATYREVRPGVDLVLTATSGLAGGFREVLVVRSARAALGLQSLVLGVTTLGTRLGSTAGGGLVAPLGRGAAFVAPPPAMWDSPAGAVLTGGFGVRGSGISGPGAGARLARVRAVVADGGSALRLVPDGALLASPTARFPLYIDPTLTLQTAPDGTAGASDVVQSGCPNTQNYNSRTYTDDDSVEFRDQVNVGADPWTGVCGSGNVDSTYFQVSVPSAINEPGVHLVSTTVQVQENYSTDCYASGKVTLSWTWGISPSTVYPGPGNRPDNHDVTNTVGPDYTNSTTYSCSNGPNGAIFVVDSGLTKKSGFDVMSDFSNAPGSPFTFRLAEPSGSSSDLFKHFAIDTAHAPYLQITYFNTPDTPTSSLAENTAATSTGQIACASSASTALSLAPSQADGGVYVSAKYTDPNPETLQGNLKYWVDGHSSSAVTVANAVSAASGTVGWSKIPWSFLSGQPPGTVIDWQTQAETGQQTIKINGVDKTFGPYTSGWSGTCYFKVYPGGLKPPTVVPGFDASVPQPSFPQSGSTVSFTITQTAGSTATSFVWALNATPPTSNVPAAQQCTPASSTCKITSGVATLKVVVPAPGPQVLNVYETVSGISSSGNAAVNFTGKGDPNDQYTAGPTLQANFAAALAATKSYDSTLISTLGESQCGATGGDGGGRFLDAKQLTNNAGWTPGGQLTVNGASFTMPSFGSCGPDNLLSANQTIGTGTASGSNLTQGGAVVFLATATNTDVGVSGLMSGSQDSTGLTADRTAPPVMGGTSVTGGSGCMMTKSFASTPCVPASGTVNYATGCPSGPAAPVILTAPDWVNGPADIQAVSVTDRVTGAGLQADSPKIYAFAVPVDPRCQIVSVTLPDVGAAAVVTTPSGAISMVATLNIFGISVRNTTTTTPEALGSQPSPPSGQAWTGAFESSIEGAFGPPSGVTWGNQTIRIAASPTVSAPANTAQVRIRLTDPGFLANDGTGPLQVGAASIANGYYGAAPGETPVALTFGGAGHFSVTIPKGGDAYSDPVTLPFAVTAGNSVLVSLWVQNSSLPLLPINVMGDGTLAWFAANGSGNQSEDTSGTPFTGTGSSWIGAGTLLTGVDVTTPAVTLQQTASPGAPTVIVAGNNVTDGWTASALSDTLNSPSKRLAGQLYSQDLLPGYGIVEAGIQSNEVLADQGGGVSLAARLDRDILAEPDVGTVIIDQGLYDVLKAQSETKMVNGYQALVAQLNQFGINVMVATLTPCSGYTGSGDSCSATVADPTRVTLNTDIKGGKLSGAFCPADTDTQVSGGQSPELFASGYGRPDNVNLEWAGYAQLALAFTNAITNVCVGPNMNPTPNGP